MNLRTRYRPGVYTVTDDDTGEILIFSLMGTLEFVRVYDLNVRRTVRRTPLADYVASEPE